MLNISRSVLLAVYAAAWLSSNTPMSSIMAVASPIPNALETRTTSNRLGPVSRTSTNFARSQSRSGHAQPIIRGSALARSSSILNLVPMLCSKTTEGRRYNQRFATLASNPSEDPKSRQDFLEELHLWLQSLALLLKPYGAAKGLLNYNRDSEVQTALKDLINVHKDLLLQTYLLTDEDAPELADIVYDIKCILEFLLDFTENTTDGLLNDYLPQV